MNDTPATDFENNGIHPVRAEELLPPVQPPVAAFLMKLFFIPLIIVTIIVLIWLLFSWMARAGSQPGEMIADLERLDHTSWSQALNLANRLRDPQGQALRQDSALANRLAEVLDHHLTNSRMDAEHIRLRMFLCRALGEFEVTDGLPTLIRAANQQRSTVEAEAQRAAVQAIAIMADRTDFELMDTPSNLVKTLSELSAVGVHAGSELDPIQTQRLRSSAVYALGILEDETAKKQLVGLLEDAHPNIRFNAAIGLARHGDQRAMPLLLRMLDPQNQALVEGANGLHDASWKQEHVLINAVRATIKLIKANPVLEASELVEALRMLANADVSSAVKITADEGLRALPEIHTRP